MQHEQAVALVATASSPKVQADFSGTWKNDLENSHMTLVQSGQTLSGEFTSPDGNGSTITGPLIGWADGNIISFTVNWPNPSITAWTGHLVTENDADAVESLWNLALPMNDPSDSSKLWTAMFAGSDRFTRD